MDVDEEYFTLTTKTLTEEEKTVLLKQNSRTLSDFTVTKLEEDAQKHWDLFYKRNCERFFKNRYWTMKEFEELAQGDRSKSLLEVGCGVGNLIYPLVEENLFQKIYACDFSPRAIQLVKQHPRYDPAIISAFQADATQEKSFLRSIGNLVDIITMVFVFSAINPIKFPSVVRNIASVLKPGGIVFFRDYGLYDMTQLRFKPGHKIAEKFYVRQDGTRSYFFSTEELASLFLSEGFEVITNTYVHRRTINRKESLDVPRVFVQAKFIKKKAAGWRFKWWWFAYIPEDKSSFKKIEV